MASAPIFFSEEDRPLTALPVGGENVKKGWQFLSRSWWVVHFLGFTLVYAAGRLTAALMKG